MLFKYKAITPEGKVVEGEIERESESEVLRFLKSQELTPLSVKEKKAIVEKIFGASLKKIFKKGISLEDQLFLVRYLGLMLRGGVDLLETLTVLEKDFQNPAIKRFLIFSRESLKKGRSFYESFSAFPHDFSPTFVALIKAGEVSGKLDEVCKILAQNIEREIELKRKLKSALTYPIMLIILAIIVLSIVITFSIPKIAVIFEEISREPPLFNKIILSLSFFLRKYGIFLLLSIVTLVVFIYLFYQKTLTGKRFFQNLIVHLPIVKKVVEKIDVQKFTQNFSAMVEAGVPILQAIEVSRDTLTTPKMKLALDRIAEKIKKGVTIGEAFLEEKKAFPLTLVSLISISEKAGRLSFTLKELSDFFAGEIDATVKSLTSLIEPIILMMIGGIVALLALGVIVPLYQTVTTMAQ
ncbi:MAG TPA: type II secretion system F family protein [bacterium]|nr:type II secretion system F family protein [bacterium]